MPFPRGRTSGEADGYPVAVFLCPPFSFFVEGGHQEEVIDIQWRSSNAYLFFLFIKGEHQEEVMDIQLHSSNPTFYYFS
jgi:hypothetical protein